MNSVQHTAAAASNDHVARPGQSFGHDWLVWLPVLASFALFAPLNQNFGFDTPGWLDAFVYVGYFWHYPEHLAIFDDYYKASRLPWVLPGFVSHRLLGPIAGSYLLHWATLAGSGVALYLLLRSTLRNRTAAATAAVAWVCSTAAHGVGGWNYHIVAAAGYYLLASWLLVREKHGEWKPMPVTAGAAFACAVHTHLFLAVFAPLIGWLYLVALSRAAGTWRRLVKDVALVAAGAVGLTLTLMAINRLSGGDWLFFMPQINYTIWIAQPGNNVWYFDAAQWLPAAKYLVIPLLCLIAGTLAVRRSSREEPWQFTTALVLQGWAALLVAAYYQFAQRQSVLDHDYMAFVIDANAFAAFGVALARGTRSTTAALSTTRHVAIACIVIVGALLLGMPDAVPQTLERLQALFGTVWPVIPPFVIGLAAAVVVACIPGRLRLVAWAVWFSILNVWLAPDRDAYGLNQPGIQRSMLTLFREADDFTARLDPSLGAIEYWFPKEQVTTVQGPVNLNAVFDSYVAVRGWAGNLLAGESPGRPIDKIGPAQLEGVTCLGVLSSIPRHEQLLSELRARLASEDVNLREVGARQFKTPELSFALTVYRLNRGNGEPTRPGAAAPPCSP